MSKLSALRAGKAAPSAIFSNTVSPEVQAVFQRIQEGKPSRTYEKKKWLPSRFRCSAGETKRLVVLDAQVTYAHAEHSVKHYSPQNPQGKWETERCISAVDACPICSLPKHNPSDKILLTVLDLTPWSFVNKDGVTIEKEYTKRELAIGTKQLGMFQAYADAHGGFRGIILEMKRGHEKLEAGHGVPSFVQKLTEEELIEMFGHQERKADDGRVIVQENQDIMPFDYAAIHVMPSRSDLANKYGIAPRPGSVEELQQEETPEVEEQVTLMDFKEELPDIDG